MSYPILVDAFLYYNESSMLRARIEYLSPVVDEFILVESETDHSNRPNPHFASWMEVAGEFPNVKIRAVRVPLSTAESNWPRVWGHRNGILHGLDLEDTTYEHADILTLPIPDDSLVMISDIDEFPRREILEQLKKAWIMEASGEGECDPQFREMIRLLYLAREPEPHTILFHNRFFYYDLLTTRDDPWPGTRLTTAGHVRHVSPEVVRRWPRPLIAFEEAGWHLSYFGSVEQIKNKMESIAESPFTGQADFTDPARIADVVKAGRDLYDRKGEKWYKLPAPPPDVPEVLLKHFPPPISDIDAPPPVVEAREETPETRAAKALLYERFGLVTLSEPYIYEHLPTLARVASECESIAETGFDIGASTTAFLLGLSASRSPNPSLVTVDIRRNEVAEASVRRIAEGIGVHFTFLEQDSKTADIPEVDFLFIDCLHEGGHLAAVLDAHAHKARKYIGFHDTNSPFSFQGEGGGEGILGAIQSFADKNPDWKLHTQNAHCNGLLLLKKEPTPPTPAHLGGHGGITHTDEAVLRAILDEYPGLVQFVDIGCGPGGMLPIAERYGLHPIGVDGDPQMEREGVILHDYTTGRCPHLIPPSSKRLVWSVEFVEHVHEPFANNFLDDFATGDVVFMTHAVPGQAGYHHVNLQPSEYWVAKMGQRGFTWDVATTIKCREVATDQYTKATGLVFVRGGEIDV